MGDSLAATILKLLDSDRHLGQSISETLFSKAVTAVGASMRYPSDIQDKRHRIPSASLRLLRRLEPIAKSQEQRSRILNLITTFEANHELGTPEPD
jgi:hypothetical protein